MSDRDYQIYFFECDWYNDRSDEECHNQGILMASSLGEAANAIDKRFPYADNVTIRLGDDTRFVCLNKTLYNKMIDPDNSYGLDYPGAGANK